MIDIFKRPELPFHAPEPIRDLIAAINDKARTAQTGLFTMMALGIYIIATSFSTTDFDLLMEKSTPIPQLGVQLPVVVSFAIAPVVFLALHVFTLVRYHLLSHDLRALTAELDAHVPDPRDRARCHRLLANTEFVQAMSAQPGTRLRAALLTMLFWTMVGIMPVSTLLIVEISALRLQEASLNDLQRLVIVADLALLFSFAWQWRPARTARTAARRWHDRPLRWLRSVPGVGAKALAAAAAAYVIYFIHVYAVPPRPGDFTVAIGRTARDAQHAPPGSWPARLREQPLDLVFCPSLDWGCRYLSVEHRLIVSQIWDKSAIAKLRSAEHPIKYLASVDGAYLVDRHLLFADFADSRLYVAKLAHAQLQHADFQNASMQGADLKFASMQGANLELTSMQDATFLLASMQGADLFSASMQGADLMSASMQGADLKFASMQGADLMSASMQGADLKFASMQGADMFSASMQGADLSNASMQGADLRRSRQYGASGAVAIRFADLRNADFTSRADGKTLAQIASITATIGRNVYPFPNFIIQWPISLLLSERELRAAHHAGAPLPTYEAAPHSVLVVMRSRHGHEPFPPRLRPFVTDDRKNYFLRLSKYLASHVASWGPAAASGIAWDRALDARSESYSPQGARAIGCALRSAKAASFAGHEKSLALLKKNYPRSVCRFQATHSRNTLPASKSRATATRHAAK